MDRVFEKKRIDAFKSGSEVPGLIPGGCAAKVFSTCNGVVVIMNFYYHTKRVQTEDMTKYGSILYTPKCSSYLSALK